MIPSEPTAAQWAHFDKVMDSALTARENAIKAANDEYWKLHAIMWGWLNRENQE